MSRERSGIGTGLVLITIGGILLADRQGYGGFGNLWPLILIVIGLSHMLFRDQSIGVVVMGPRGTRRVRRASPFNGLWLILVGVIFLLHQNHILSLHQSWPLFIVAAGVGIIFSGILRSRSEDDHPGDPTIGGGGQAS